MIASDDAQNVEEEEGKEPSDEDLVVEFELSDLAGRSFCHFFLNGLLLYLNLSSAGHFLSEFEELLYLSHEINHVGIDLWLCVLNDNIFKGCFLHELDL